MKIDFKKRLKNPLFLVQIFLAIFVPILGYYGLTAKDLTTWKSVLDLIMNALANPYVMSLIIVSLWNAVNDPTSKGFGDKESN